MSDLDWIRRTFAYKTGLGMTEPEKEQYEQELKVKSKQFQCDKCHEFRDWNMSHSPSVKFMIEQVNRIGGNIGPSNIKCEPCDEYKGGGFHPELGILLCQNRMKSRQHLEDTLAHELVHAYDHCRFNVNWGDLKHHACSEIRASNLSGECRMMNQIARNRIFKVFKGQQSCVRRRAILSVSNNPNCKDMEQAAQVVDQVFESCYADTRPYDDIYR